MSVARAIGVGAVVVAAACIAIGARAWSPADVSAGAASIRAARAASCPDWRRSRSWSPARELTGAKGYAAVAGAPMAVAPSGRAIAALGPGLTMWRRPAGGRFERGGQLSIRRTSSGGVYGTPVAMVGFAAERPIVVWNERRRLFVGIGRPRGGGFRIGSMPVGRGYYLSLLLAGTRRPPLLVWDARTGTFAADVGATGLRRSQRLPANIGFVQAAAVDASGSATVLTSVPRALVVLDRAPGRPFAVTGRVPAEDYPVSPRVARDPRGGASLVWRKVVAAAPQPPARGDEVAIVEGASRPPGGSFGAPRVLSTPGTNVTSVAATAVDSRGNAIAVWVERGTRGWRLVGRERRAGGDWGASAVLLTSRQALHVPRVVRNERGQAAVVVAAACPSHTALIGLRRSRPGGWGGAEVVAAWPGYVARDHDVAIDGRGGLTEIWSRRLHEGGGLGTAPVVVATRSP